MNFQELADMVLTGDNKGAEKWTRDALKAGVAPKEIIDKGLVPGMDVVGKRFKSNEFHMPEVLIAARAMKASMNLVRPLISEADKDPTGTVVIGTVQGDLHDIGKNLVAMMLEGAGFEVIDLGVDVSPQAFVEATESRKANVVCLSALLTTTMPMMRNVIQAVEEAELRAGVKILIGGAPVSQAYADQITADGYAPDGASAVDIAKSLLGR